MLQYVLSVFCLPVRDPIPIFILIFYYIKVFSPKPFFKKGWKIPRGKSLVKQKVRTKMPNHAEQLAQELNLSLKNVQGAI
ncbi:MAG: hypothetical protein WAQ76_03715, partial [Gemmiger qucibialis]